MRNTIQKELVLKAVFELHCHVTAEDVHNFIVKEHPSVSLGTVYRNLKTLSEEGKVKKIAVTNGPDMFDFNLSNHYHVRCIKCGRVEDVILTESPDYLPKVSDSAGFTLLGYDLIFNGICEKCLIENE